MDFDPLRVTKHLQKVLNQNIVGRNRLIGCCVETKIVKYKLSIVCTVESEDFIQFYEDYGIFSISNRLDLAIARTAIIIVNARTSAAELMLIISNGIEYKWMAEGKEVIRE